MIKINLLPTKRKKKSKPIPQFLLAGIGLLLVTLAVTLFLMYSVNGTISELEAKKKRNDQKISQLQKKINEVKQFEDLNKTFQQRKNIVEQLTKNQSVPVRILDEVSRTLSDGVWINSMSINKDKVSLTGIGFSNSDIVTYIQKIKTSKMFSTVRLHGTTRTAVGDVEAYSFNITFNVRA